MYWGQSLLICHLYNLRFTVGIRLENVNGFSIAESAPS